MNIKEFNEMYQIHIESLATTLGGLTSVEMKDEQKPIMDYIKLLDSQYNLSYTVIDKETLEEVYRVDTESDLRAVESIMKEFNITV